MNLEELKELNQRLEYLIEQGAVVAVRDGDELRYYHTAHLDNIPEDKRTLSLEEVKAHHRE